MIALPFQAGRSYKFRELRQFATEIIASRQSDTTFSAIMREQPEKWIKDWNEEFYPLKVFADHRAISDDAEFSWTPDGAADFTVRSNGKAIKVQSTMAYVDWEHSIAKQGGHLHKLEMRQLSKVGHSFPGGLITEPKSRSPETDVDAWRHGIAQAVKRKLQPGYAGVHLLVFAHGASGAG